MLNENVHHDIKIYLSHAQSLVSDGSESAIACSIVVHSPVLSVVCPVAPSQHESSLPHEPQTVEGTLK